MNEAALIFTAERAEIAEFSAVMKRLTPGCEEPEIIGEHLNAAHGRKG